MPSMVPDTRARHTCQEELGMNPTLVTFRKQERAEAKLTSAKLQQNCRLSADGDC